MTQTNLPWIESPFFDEILLTKNFSAEDRQMAEDYHKNGFVVIRNAFDAKLADRVRVDMDEKGFNPAFKMKGERDHVRVLDLWKHSESVKKLATDGNILRVLEMLYGREPMPFQTLNFKVGTQQRAHSDTIHFSSIPARYMCGVWVALEDIGPENGAVFYYPGSHRMPEYDFSYFRPDPSDTSYDDYIEYEDFIEKITKKHGYEAAPFYAKKGDALIWSSNIIHGGSPLLDPNSSRYSQVTHYYFKDCIYYTPMLSNMVTNELFLRNAVTDIKTGKPMAQSFNGQPVKIAKRAKHKYSLKAKRAFTIKGFFNRIFSK